MKMIRWGGLVGFVLFTAVLVVVGFIFLDGWVKKGIETAGMNINGSEVNVGKVDLTLNPLGFKLNNIEISDPEKPTHNALVLTEARLDVNFLQLFLGNVRVNDLIATDIQTNVERSKPARLLVKKESSEQNEGKIKAAAQEKVAAISQSLPSVSDVVENQSANTRNAIDTAQSTISTSKQDVGNAVTRLPGDQALKDYKKRIAELKALPLDSLENLVKTQKLVQSLSTDIAKDKISIETVKITINRSVKDSREAVEQILAGPAKDLEQLKKDYPLNKDSALKVAELLLGKSFFQKIDQATYWYGKAKPWLARLKSEPEADKPERLTGEFVRFYHPAPTAAFQLDNGLVSFVADQWPWELTVSNLVSEQSNSSQPILMQLRRGAENAEALLVTGKLEQINNQSVDSFNVLGRGISFADQKISLADAELTWSPKKSNVSGDIKSIGGALSGVVSLQFPQNNFSITGDGDTQKYLEAAVKKISSFKIDVLVSGTIKKPKFTINSDLDNQLGSALKGVAEEEYKKWLADVKSQLTQEVTRLRKPVDGAFSELTDKRDEAEHEIEEFEQDVENELRSLEEKIEKEKKRLEKEAQDKLDAVKQEAEDAAKKAAEDKLKDEVNKLKDKIKF